MLRLSIVVVLVIGLAACQPGPDDVLDDYLERLERVLQHNRPDIRIALPQRPPRHALLPETGSLRVSLLSPLSLKPCGVLPLIAEHNSSLGKVATPMHQWLYHQKLVSGLQDCEPDSLSQEGQALRSKVLAQRLPELPLLFRRLLLLSDAVWFNFGDNRPGWQWQGAQPLLESLEALQHQRALRSTSNETKLFSHLQQWEVSQLPASLHRSMVSTIRYLNQASALLNQAGPKACRRDGFEPLKGILRAIYGKRVQPELVITQRLDHQLTPLLRDLLSPLPEHPYFAFYLGDEPTSLRHAYYQAIDEHTEAWQHLLRRCQGNADVEAQI